MNSSTRRDLLPALVCALIALAVALALVHAGAA